MLGRDLFEGDALFTRAPVPGDVAFVVSGHLLLIRVKHEGMCLLYVTHGQRLPPLVERHAVLGGEPEVPAFAPALVVADQKLNEIVRPRPREILMRKQWELTDEDRVYVVVLGPFKVVVDHLLIVIEVDARVELAQVSLNIERLLHIDVVDHVIVRQSGRVGENRQKRGAEPCVSKNVHYFSPGG